MTDTEKRSLERVSLRLPVVVLGRAEDGAVWCEPAQTEDILPVGLSLRLSSGCA